MKVFLMLGILFVMACASSHSPTVTKIVFPSGNKGFAIDCSSLAKNIDCMVAMGQVCPQGYQVVQNTGPDYLIVCAR